MAYMHEAATANVTKACCTSAHLLGSQVCYIRSAMLLEYKLHVLSELVKQILWQCSESDVEVLTSP